MKRRNWERAELVLALQLYYQIPFGQFTATNPHVMKLAERLGRTPGAVAMKLSNFVRFDTTMNRQKGLEHGGKLDEIIWKEFENRHWDLAIEAEKISTLLAVTHTISDIDMVKEGHVKLVKRKDRIGQDFFRSIILTNYGNQCCMTGIAIPSLLIASHIKPWAQSDDATEKVNPTNGLCLNALHDKAFDQGLITLDGQYRLVVSEKLKTYPALDETTKAWICQGEGEMIHLPERGRPSQRFLEYHRDCVFQHM